MCGIFGFTSTNFSEDEMDIENDLSKFIKDFILNAKNSFFGDRKKIEKYQRKEQVKKLAILLDKL